MLAPPVNVLRLSLAPRGLASRIFNLGEWRHHLLGRLHQDADRAGDPMLWALHTELSALPFIASRKPPAPLNPIAVALMLADPATGAVLSLLSTTTVFGTATDITLAEITLECFYPADDGTRVALIKTAEAQRNVLTARS